MWFGIFIALGPLLCGYLIKLTNKNWMKKIDRSLSLLVYLILFIMGCELAQLNDLPNQLQTIAYSMLVLFVCSFGFNVIILMAMDMIVPWKSGKTHQSLSSNFKLVLESLTICFALIIGFICGLIPLSLWQYNALFSKIVLIILLFLVGIQLRGNNISIKQILLNKIGLTTSILVIISSLFGGFVASYLLDLPAKTAMAMSSGFGWYSLSGILMTEAHGAVIGSITFLNDILRELCAIILLPILIKRFRLTSLGICAATSMDFTLPMLQKGGGITMVPPAIVQGFLLTLIMPILMTLLNYYF